MPSEKSRIVGIYSPPADAEEARQRVWSNIGLVVPFFRERYERGMLNYAFYRGQQWTPEEERMIRQQFRYPYVFNEIFQKIDFLRGMQIQTRMDVQLLARESWMAPLVNILDRVYKLVESLNSMEFVESDVFQDAIVYGVGWYRVSWSNEDVPVGIPRIERVPPYDVIWDINAVERDLSDAMWLARVTWYTRQELSEMLPEFSEVIRNVPDELGRWGVGLVELPYFPLIRGLSSPIPSLIRDNPLLTMVPFVEYYEKLVTRRWVVCDKYRGDSVEFDDYKEAESYWRGKVDEYAESGEVLSDETGAPMVYIEEFRRTRYVQTLMIGSEVVSSEEVDVPAYPYVPMFAYFANGDWWSVVDNLRDPQVFVNRFLSEWDYQLGTAAKNPVTVVETQLKRGYTVEEVRAELSRRSPVIPVISHQAIQFHPSQHPLPELFQGVGFGIARMEAYMGGRNALGLAEHAGESGRAVMMRSELGGTMRLPLFDNLRYARMRVAEQVVWYLQNFADLEKLILMATQNVVPELNEAVDRGVIDTLREIRVHIVVDEARHSATQQERMFTLLKEYFATVGAPPEVAMPLLLKYSPLPERDKEEILAMMDFYKEYMTQKAELARRAKMERQAREQVEKAFIRHSIAQQLGIQTRPRRMTAEEYGAPTPEEQLQRSRTLPELESLARAASNNNASSASL